MRRKTACQAKRPSPSEARAVMHSRAAAKAAAIKHSPRLDEGAVKNDRCTRPPNPCTQPNHSPQASTLNPAPAGRVVPGLDDEERETTG